MHAMQAIAQSGSMPMQKQPLPVNTFDDRTTGKLFAQEVIAKMIGDASGWKTLVHRMFSMTVEARTVAVEQLGKWKGATVESIMDLHKMDERAAKKFLNSAATRISQITKIAKAINGGMTYTTLSEAWKCNDPEFLSIDAIYKTATEFSGADARGRKADPFIVKLGKWLHKNKPDADASAEEAKHYDAIVAEYNKYAPSVK